MEFDTLVLSLVDECKLRRIVRHPAENKKAQADSLAKLLDCGFVSLENCQDDDGHMASAFFVTADGENYLRYIRRRRKEFGISTGISLVAVLISLVALIRTL